MTLKWSKLPDGGLQNQCHSPIERYALFRVLKAGKLYYLFACWFHDRKIVKPQTSKLYGSGTQTIGETQFECMGSFLTQSEAKIRASELMTIMARSERDRK